MSVSKVRESRAARAISGNLVCASSIDEAVERLGLGALSEDKIVEHIYPLFSGVLSGSGIYLANHSLGRPLDQSALDLAEAFSLWQRELGDAWSPWSKEEAAHRSRFAQVINAPRADCVVPKTSAGQGLRTVLNALGAANVVTTRGEFDSTDLVMKQYGALGHINVRWLEQEADGRFEIEKLAELVRKSQTDLVVVSQVMFATGQLLHGLKELAAVCHERGARLLVDAYHAIGALPVDVTAMGADFMIGGSYKYLRGGPGACFLYIAPSVLEAGLRPLDTGWFAKPDSFAYERPDPPQLKQGGDAFLESTPPIFTYYQARAGQRFTLAMRVERLREYSLDRLRRLRGYLEQRGISSIGGDQYHGAFLTVSHAQAPAIAVELAKANIHCDARGWLLRICPDCLTREEELRIAAEELAKVMGSIR